ncbi:hypothetical protein BB31_42050 [Amycolatopsis lurida NRRL 2430]|uniref:Uncharacterized protein n=1 Tax=Amycolatopsis lurida NRRL 2430 TaxID=1460371 RepID=A0A2P2FF51_AMYLU|nr:hypothetical protein BB31_42050 [Amycolatopsis lurida NRRL 2430]
MNQRPVSNRSVGSGLSCGCSNSKCSPMVWLRDPIRRDRSSASPSSTMALSSASESTSGRGTRWMRRNQPIWPSTPPFSWAPSIPGRQ